MTYKLRNAFNVEFASDTPGTIGGHKGQKIYGNLDCPSALRWLAKGHYTAQRVFFADEKTAVSAGYRPCGVCRKDDYKEWKAEPSEFKENILSSRHPGAGRDPS